MNKSNYLSQDETPICLETLRQLIFDCATDLQYGYSTKEYIIAKLYSLCDKPITGEELLNKQMKS